MIRWCSYCQSFIGQRPPLNDFSFTHGICQSCKAAGAGATGEFKNPEIESFFKGLFKNISLGAFIEPALLYEKSKELKIGLADLLLGVLHPLLSQIGQYFEEGKISVEKEHLFSKSVNAMLEIGETKHAADTQDVILFPAPGNVHRIGLEFLKRLLESDQRIHGVMITEPPSSPAEYFALLRDRHPKVIGASIALPEHVTYIEELISWHREAAGNGPAPTIMVGGPAFWDPSVQAELKEVVFVSDPSEAKSSIEKIAQLCAK